MATDLMDRLEGLVGDLPNWPQLQEAGAALTRPADEGGFDPWPFNNDRDGLDKLQEIQNNVRLVKDLIVEVVTTVEYLAAQISEMGSEKKLEKAVDLLAPIIKSQLVGVARPVRLIVRPILKHLISAVVDWLNREAGSEDAGKSFLPDAEAATA